MDAHPQGWEPIAAPRTFAEALRLLRQRAGLTRDELAEVSGIAGGTISNYETGKTRQPRAADLRRVSRALARALGEDPARISEELLSLLDRERDRDDVAVIDAAVAALVGKEGAKGDADRGSAAT